MSIHAIFDTVILLQGATKQSGPAGRCLLLVAEGKVLISMSLEGMIEITDVLRREKVRKRFPRLTDEIADQFLADLRFLAQMVDAPPPVFHYKRDPDDDHVLNLAIASGAKYIVTRDADLLDLMKEGNADMPALRAMHPDLTILEPVAFLTMVDATEIAE